MRCFEKEHLLLNGSYRLTISSDLDIFRQSTIQVVMRRIKKNDACVKSYNPLWETVLCFMAISGPQYREDQSASEAIIANRYDSCLDDVEDKVYTRDLFRRD